MFIWICAAVKQYGGFFSSYFITLALSDPASLFIRLFVDVDPIKIFVTFMIVALYSCYLKDKYILFKPIKAQLIFLLFIPLVFANSKSSLDILLIIVDLLLLLEFIKRFFIELINNKINIYVIILIIYELTTIIKFIVANNESELGILYFTSTSVFEIFIGIFFIFFKEDSPKILFNTPKSLHMD